MPMRAIRAITIARVFAKRARRAPTHGTFQTAPARDESLFVAMASAVGISARLIVVPMLAPLLVDGPWWWPTH